MATSESAPENNLQLDSKPASTTVFDFWLGRITNFSQIILAGFAVYAIIFTVIPLYQNAELSERIAIREAELKNKETQIFAVQQQLTVESQNLVKAESASLNIYRNLYLENLKSSVFTVASGSAVFMMDNPTPITRDYLEKAILSSYQIVNSVIKHRSPINAETLKLVPIEVLESINKEIETRLIAEKSSLVILLTDISPLAQVAPKIDKDFPMGFYQDERGKFARLVWQVQELELQRAIDFLDQF